MCVAPFHRVTLKIRVAKLGKAALSLSSFATHYLYNCCSLALARQVPGAIKIKPASESQKR